MNGFFFFLLAVCCFISSISFLFKKDSWTKKIAWHVQQQPPNKKNTKNFDSKSIINRRIGERRGIMFNHHHDGEREREKFHFLNKKKTKTKKRKFLKKKKNSEIRTFENSNVLCSNVRKFERFSIRLSFECPLKNVCGFFWRNKSTNGTTIKIFQKKKD